MYGALLEEDDDDDEEDERTTDSEIPDHLLERRREEEEALLAIYGEDEFSIVKEGCVQLRVSPTRPWETKGLAPPCVVLTVRFGSKYPEEAVEGIDVETAGDSGRVPGKTLKKLREGLRSRADELCGEVAVHELGVVVAEALDRLDASDLQQSMLQREAAELERERDQLERDQVARAAEAEVKRRKAEETVATQERRAGRLIVSPSKARVDALLSDNDVEEEEEEEAETTSSSDQSSKDDSSWDESSDEVSDELESRYAKDFKELAVLGRGGFGEVTRCVNKLDKREYAVKRVRLAASASKRDVARQLREVEALASVFHPHIVRYYQSWIEHYGSSGRSAHVQSDKHDDDDDDSLLKEQEKHLNQAPFMMMPSTETAETSSQRGNKEEGIALYIQMEYASTTLRALIDQRALEGRPDDYWRLLRQMLEALAYLHNLDMVHRDIKPPNIFIDSNGNAKIGDLGLATTVARAEKEMKHEEARPTTPKNASDQLYSSRSLTWGVGTALYRAPEVTSGQRRYDASADVFSLGVVLYEMAQPPFETGMERIEALQSLRRGEPTWKFTPGANDEDIIKLVPRLVARRPEQRPTASALLEGKEPGLLPAAADALDETQALLLARAKATIRDPFASARSQLIAAIFDSQTAELLEFTYGKSLKNAVDWNDDALYKNSRTANTWAMRFRALAEARGAIDLPAPLLRPRPSLTVLDGEAKAQVLEANAVELLDSDGTVVVLPTELTTPFARLVAMSLSINKKKKTRSSPGAIFRRYELGRVHSKIGGPSLQAAYDVVRFDNGPTRTLEAECIALGLAWSRHSNVLELHLEHADLPTNLATLRRLDTDLERRLGGSAKRKSATLFPLERLAAAVDKVRRSNDETRDKPRRFAVSALAQLRTLMACVDFNGLVLVDTAPPEAKIEGMSPFGQVGCIAFRIFCKSIKSTKRLRSISANSDDLEVQTFDDTDDQQLLCVGGRYEVTRFLSPRDRGIIGVRCVGLRFLYRALSPHIEQPPPLQKCGVRVVVCGDGTDAADDEALALAARLRHTTAIDSAEHAPRFVHKGRTPSVDDIVASAKGRGCNAVVVLVKGRCVIRIETKRYEKRVQDLDKFFRDEVPSLTLSGIGDDTDDHHLGGSAHDAPLTSNTSSGTIASSSAAATPLKPQRIRFMDLTMAAGQSGAAGNLNLSKGSRHHKQKLNAEAMKRRASRALTTLLGSPVEFIDAATTGIDTLCLAVDAPLVALRRATSAVLAKQPLTGDRRGALRAYADSLRDQRAGTLVWAFSSVDSAFDLAVVTVASA